MKNISSNFRTVCCFLALILVLVVTARMAIADQGKLSLSEDEVAEELGIDPVSYKRSERIRDFLEIIGVR